MPSRYRPAFHTSKREAWRSTGSRLSLLTRAGTAADITVRLECAYASPSAALISRTIKGYNVTGGIEGLPARMIPASSTVRTCTREQEDCGIGMDVERAVESFLKHAGELPALSLVTDAEFRKLYGGEVVAAVAVLENRDREEDICRRCVGECCRDIGCELYAPQFSQCPVHEFRPVACRLHFCHRFDDAGRSLSLALRDVFLGSLTAAEARTGEVLTALDCLPLSRCLPEFVATVIPRVEDVRRGQLCPERALTLIRTEARRHHSGLRNGSLPPTPEECAP